MKIAFIVSSFPSISETFIVNQITGLLDRGHSIEIYAFQKGDLSQIHNEIVKYDLLKKVVFIPKTPTNKIERRLLLLWNVLKKGAVNPIKVAKIIKGSIKTDFDYRAFLLALFFDERYDVTLCHFGFNAKHCSLIKKTGYSGKLIAFFHGSDVTQYPKKYGENIYEKVFQYCDSILTISNYFKSKLMRLGCPEDKISIHHMGVNVESFSYARRLFSNVPKLLILGRLTEKKGHKYAIDAVQMLVEKGYNCKLIIAGDGELKGEIVSKVKSLKLDDVVSMVGRVTSDQAIQLYKECDICLVPSVTAVNGDMEGLPVVIMEALSSGLPVIATNHSSIPEIIEDNKTGFIVKEKDSDMLCSKIIEVFNNYNDISEVTIQGRGKIEDEFNIIRLNLMLEKLLSC